MCDSVEDEFVIVSVWNSFKDSLKKALENVTNSNTIEIISLNDLPLKIQYINDQCSTQYENHGNLISDEFDFEKKNSRCNELLTKWYGLKEFIVISAINDDLPLSNFNDIQYLWSSILVLQPELSILLPIFIKIHQNDCFQGVYLDRNKWKTSFEIVDLERVPYNFYNLEAILNLFKSKISSRTFNLKQCKISCQFLYKVNQLIVPDDEESIELINSFRNVPFGVNEGLIKNLFLRTKWFNLFEDSFIDTEIRSDFSPLLAHEWTFQIEWDDMCIGLLSDFLQRIVYDPDFQLDIPISCLDHKTNCALNQQEINTILDYLFLDDPNENVTIDHTDKLKSCEKNSLLWKLAIVLLKQESILAFGCIWQNFIQEVQSRCRLGVPISGVSSGYPSLKTCLLHQKLQQLNYCIDNKNMKEEAKLNFINQELSFIDLKESDEEFYDCESDISNIQNIDGQDAANVLDFDYHYRNAPVGRLKKFLDLRLLQNNAPMYVPETQSPMPRTEDEMDEDSNSVLETIDSETRILNMGSLLFSDMQSFKAANPGAIFEDFIRWYSPHDWIQTDNDCGKLSERMLISDNVWLRFWQSAKSIPAFRQKTLSDDSEQIEKVLNYLKTRKISEIIDLIIPVILHMALDKICSEAVNMNVDMDLLQDVNAKIGLFLRSEYFDRIQLERILSEIRNKEIFLSKMRLLKMKFSKYNLNVDDICNADEISISLKEDDLLRNDLWEILKVYETVQKPFEKEFVLKLHANRPHSYSRSHLQFMRAIFNENQYRLIGAFSEDLF